MTPEDVLGPDDTLLYQYRGFIDVHMLCHRGRTNRLELIYWYHASQSDGIRTVRFKLDTGEVSCNIGSTDNDVLVSRSLGFLRQRLASGFMPEEIVLMLKTSAGWDTMHGYARQRYGVVL